MKNIQTQPYFVDKRHVFTKKKKVGKTLSGKCKQ